MKEGGGGGRWKWSLRQAKESRGGGRWGMREEVKMVAEAGRVGEGVTRRSRQVEAIGELDVDVDVDVDAEVRWRQRCRLDEEKVDINLDSAAKSNNRRP